MTDPRDPRLKGRQPEFARMSKYPGIGAESMSDVGDTLLTEQGAQYIIENGDVAHTLQHGKKKYPLGRYLRKKLREVLGFNETGSQKESLTKWKMQLRAMHEEKIADTNNKGKTYKELFIEPQKQKILNMESNSSSADSTGKTLAAAKCHPILVSKRFFAYHITS